MKFHDNSRRSLLQGMGAACLSAALPARAAASNAADERILVVVGLTGANDGVNTLAPYGNDLYHTAAPNSGEPYGWLGRLADAIDPALTPNFLVGIGERQSLSVHAAGHVHQSETHQRLLSNVSRSISGLVQDMRR